jgi:ATP-dependent DNA ligase
MTEAVDYYTSRTTIPVFEPYSGKIYHEEQVRHYKRETCQLLKTGLRAFLDAGHSLERAVVSVKHNGWRFRAVCPAEGRVTFLTRNDTPYHFPATEPVLVAMAERIRDLHADWPGDVVFDGELTTPDDNPDTLHAEIDAGNDGTGLIYRVFDVIHEGMSLEQRLELLEQVYPYCRLNRLVVRVPHMAIRPATAAKVARIKELAVAAGREGIVIKNLDAPYIFRRIPDWVREVAVITEDLPVLRVEKRRAGRVSLICLRKGREVGVSAGISNRRGLDFLKNAPRLIEVTHRGETRTGSLKSASFVRVRTDKEDSHA